MINTNAFFTTFIDLGSVRQFGVSFDGFFSIFLVKFAVIARLHELASRRISTGRYSPRLQFSGSFFSMTITTNRQSCRINRIQLDFDPSKCFAVLFEQFNGNEFDLVLIKNVNTDQQKRL